MRANDMRVLVIAVYHRGYSRIGHDGNGHVQLPFKEVDHVPVLPAALRQIERIFPSLLNFEWRGSILTSSDRRFFDTQIFLFIFFLLLLFLEKFGTQKPLGVFFFSLNYSLVTILPIQTECNDRRKKIIPNNVQTKYTRASREMSNLNT